MTFKLQVDPLGLGLAAVSVRRWRDGVFAVADDALAVEEPLEVRLRSVRREAESISMTMRTPGRDADLAVGFLFGEGIVTGPGDVIAVDVGAAGTNTVTITVAETAEHGFERLKRNFAQTSSCGVCGKRSVDDLRLDVDAAGPDKIRIDPVWLAGLPELMRPAQHLFHRTGGLHGVGLFALGAGLVASAEDVGRHNALDKLVGAAFLAGRLPWADHVLVLSGRASFELIQKAAAAGVRCVAAVGAPSSLAVSLAERAGITLAGFVRRGGFNVYTHPERVGGAGESDD